MGLSLEHDEIVVGASLNAYIYAFCKELPVLDLSNSWVHGFHELMPPGFSFGSFKSTPSYYNSNLGPFCEGDLHKEIFKNFLKFCIGINGGLIMSDPPNANFWPPRSVVYHPDISTISIARSGVEHTVSFGRATVFDESIPSLIQSSYDNVIFEDYYTAVPKYNKMVYNYTSYYNMDEEYPIREIHYCKSAEHNMVVISQFPREDEHNPDYQETAILMGCQFLIKQEVGGSKPYFQVNDHVRKIKKIHNSIGTTEENVVYLDDSDLIHLLSSLTVENKNYKKALQLALHDRKNTYLAEIRLKLRQWVALYDDKKFIY
jgi:hypothetical protein